MLYSKLRFSWNLINEEKTLTEERDSLCKDKLKNLKRINDLNEQLKELKAARKEIASEIDNWLDSSDMKSTLKDDIRQYYVKGGLDLYHGTNFTREVKKELNQGYKKAKSPRAEKA